MSNQTSAPPLDMNLGQIDTSMPLIKEQSLLDLRIEMAEVKKNNAGNSMIHLDHVTTTESQDREGKTLGAGVHVFNNINLVASGKATWDMVARNVAQLFQAAELPHIKWGEIETSGVQQLVGKVVRCKIGFQEAGVSANGKAYRAANTIEFYTKRS